MPDKDKHENIATLISIQKIRKKKEKKMQQKEFLMQQGFPTSEHLVAMYVETCFEFY